MDMEEIIMLIKKGMRDSINYIIIILILVTGNNLVNNREANSGKIFPNVFKILQSGKYHLVSLRTSFLWNGRRYNEVLG